MIANFLESRSLPLYTAAQVRELDRLAIHQAGIPGYTLMERAGEAAWSVLRTEWPETRLIVVLCGTGNNGGDGYIVARHALEAGYRVQVQQLGDAGRARGDALQARESYAAAGGQINGYDPEMLAEADVIVDALLGTGLERPLEGQWREAVEAVNRGQGSVLAIDIPSGLHADTGAVLGVTAKADHTVTFIGRKQGLYTGQGPEYTGHVTFTELHVPDEVHKQVKPEARLAIRKLPAEFARPRSRVAHKGDFGHVLVIGGDHGMNGAVQLAGLAALRVGAGLVSLATRAAHAALISAAAPELMSHGVETARELHDLLARASVVVIGPGLGQTRWARELLSAVLESPLPLVIDADALNLLSREPVTRPNWILTPHPGEAARLLSRDTGTIQSDRFAAVHSLADVFGGVAVLKGPGTLVATAGAPVIVLTAGNPGMATGGMGDVLSGVIAGLVAQGLDLLPSATTGVCLHGTAADRAVVAGERGLLARDVINELPAALDAGSE